MRIKELREQIESSIEEGKKRYKIKA